MDLALLGLIMASITLVLVSIQFLAFKKAMNDLSHTSGELIQTAFNEVAPQITTAIQTSLQHFADSYLGKMGGIQSGISRQLKGAERDLIAEGINQVTGIPVGDMAAKYLQKYPALQMLLPMLMKAGEGSIGGGPSHSSEFGDQRLVKR